MFVIKFSLGLRFAETGNSLYKRHLSCLLTAFPVILLSSFFRPLLNNRVLLNKNDLIIPQKMDTFIEESLWLTHRYKPMHKLTHYQNHTYILTYTHTPTLTHALTQTLTLTHTHAHTLTCTFSYTHSHMLSHTHTSTHIHILTCTLSYTCTFSHSQILILTHILTHHHIHTYTHIHTFTLIHQQKCLLSSNISPVYKGSRWRRCPWITFPEWPPSKL